MALSCLPSYANTERSWGGSHRVGRCLQVFTYPSRRPSPPHHTEAVQTCHTYNYQTHHLYLLSVFGSMFTCGIMLFRLCSFNQLIMCLAVFLINRDHRQHNKEQRSFFLKKALWKKKKGEREMKWAITVNSQWGLLLFLMFSYLR